MGGRLLLMTTVAPREIGARIKKAREAKGWTQLAFALEANVSPSTVTRWEAGKLPPVRELMRIADLLGVDADYLVETDDATDEAEGLEDLRVEVVELRERVDALLRHFGVEIPDSPREKPASPSRRAARR